MITKRAWIAASLTVLAATTAGVVSARNSELRAAKPASSSQLNELAERDVQIRVWEQALAADSESAIALGQLAGLYMQRGRESGDETNYTQAEDYARRSTAIRSNRNGAAFVTLASSMLAQHKFTAADTVVRELVAFEPGIPQYRALHGEISLELGNYDDARAAFDSLASLRTHLSIAPRLARWFEIRGENAVARKILYDALQQALTRRDLPREQVAWFHLRVGDIDQRNGRLRGARSYYERGLAIAPDDYRLLAAMARLYAVEGNPRRAIEFGERAMAIKLDPATLGMLAEAFAAIRDTARAGEYYKAMEVTVSGQPGAYHRAWSLFLLDHDKRIDEVLSNVRGELETRKDVYGYDLLAWALHKAGNDSAAKNAMTSAMRMGTRDAMLFYHAGVIEFALGNRPLARQYLVRALEINPRFHPTQPGEARALIAQAKP